MDIPADHVSLASLLKHFSKTEILGGKNKFYCDSCQSLQEAQKRLKIYRYISVVKLFDLRLPRVLVIHLKRFKYLENLGRHVKLTNRVTFPLELRLSHTSSNDKSRERKEIMYRLNSVVVHVGNDPSHGHYISVVKSMKKWWVFDDTNVEPVDEAYLAHVFGPGSRLNQDAPQKQQPQSSTHDHHRDQSNESIATFDSSRAAESANDGRRKDEPMKGYGTIDGSYVTDIPFNKKGGASLLPYGCGYILFFIAN